MRRLVLLLAACSPTDPATDATTTNATTTAPPDPTTTTPPTDTSSGAPAFDCADLPLCDDFEGVPAGGPPDAARWTVTSPNCSGAGALAVDDAQAHTGAQSLRVDGGGGYCDHIFIADTAALATLATPVYGRVWLRLAAPLGQGHTTFMTLRDGADGDKDLRMGGQSEILMWNRESDDATLPSLSPAGISMSAAIPAATWTCVEFMIDEDEGLLTTWVDGVALSGLAVDSEPTPDVDQQWLGKPMWRPSLTDFKLGWESYAGQSTTLHVDDVALADRRIGCD
jgi:hypothetical protein